MLRYYSTYQYHSGPYEEEYYPSEDESSDKDESSEEDDESDDDNHDRVCLCNPTDIRAGYCCRMPKARIAMVNVTQTDTTGG